MIEEPYELKVDKYVFKVPRDRLYTENDSWVRIDGDLATVGITDFIQNMASDILFVQFSEVGTKIQQFDELGTFESVKTMLDVISPVSGTIVEVNNRLELEPELLNRDPYGEGWFMRIRVEDVNAERGNLLSPEDYFEVLKRKVEAERLKLAKKDKNEAREGGDVR